MDDFNKEQALFFGYSNTSKSIVSSDPNDPICDAINICGERIDSNDPRRKTLNYFMQTLISNSSILFDTESYENKAICWIISQAAIDHLDECDGTLFQFGIMGLFFSSTNYLSLNPFSSSDNLCNLTGVGCDTSNKYIEELNFKNISLTGTLITEIGLLESLKIIDLSNNQLKGKISDEIFNENLPNLQIFDINNNLFEGEIPNTLLSHRSSKDINLSSNLFVGTLPSSFQKSSTLGKLSNLHTKLHLYELIVSFTFV